VSFFGKIKAAMSDTLLTNEQSGPPVKVLVVDDEHMVRLLLRRGLDPEGYSITEADGAEAASAVLEREEFDVVISDITMGEKDGVWLLENAKTKWPDTVVIMLTGNADLDTAVSCLKKGASDYILKPANIDHVIIAVEHALQWRKLVLANKEYQHELERKVTERTRELENMFLGSIIALSRSLDAKDPYTYGHSERVAALSLLIYRNLPVVYSDDEPLRLAGLFHDLGKISVSDTILQKTEKLSESDWVSIRNHPVVSEHIISEFIKDTTITKAVRHHHERFDGTGYPDGLKGDEIPLHARIIAIADTYDALTSKRTYRDSFSPEDAVAILKSVRGTQLDPEVLGIFLKIHESSVNSP
jgi:putative nucleotidyltransferase with HDIG domain